MLSGRLNGVLGDLASVFAHRGLALTGFEHGDPYGHKGEWHPSRQPEWSDEMVQAMATYAHLYDGYLEALAQAETATAERKHSEADELWASA